MINLEKIVTILGTICWDNSGNHRISNYRNDVIKEYIHPDASGRWENTYKIPASGDLGGPYPSWLMEILQTIDFRVYFNCYYRGNPDEIYISRMFGNMRHERTGKIWKIPDQCVKNLRTLTEVERIINDLPEYNTLYPVESDILIHYN